MESLNISNQAWDDRFLGRTSLRSTFLILLALMFVIGIDVGVATVAFFRLHDHLSWESIFTFFGVGIPAFAYARVIYRRLNAAQSERE